MAVPNTLLDLNDHLFAQMERLSNEELTPEELEREIERSKAISGIASEIISNANTVLAAAKFNDSKLNPYANVPRMLTGDVDKD